MEQLWQLLEDWLCILQVEFEHCQSSECEPTSPVSNRMVISAPPDLYNPVDKDPGNEC